MRRIWVVASVFAWVALLVACDRNTEPFVEGEQPRSPDLARIFPESDPSARRPGVGPPIPAAPRRGAAPLQPQAPVQPQAPQGQERILAQASVGGDAGAHA